MWALHDSFCKKSAQITTPSKARIEWCPEIAMDGETIVGYGSQQVNVCVDRAKMTISVIKVQIIENV